MRKYILLSILVCLALVTSLALYCQYQVSQTSSLTRPLFVTIENGTSFHRFSQQLVELKLLENRLWLKTYVRFFPKLAHIKAGTYQILPQQTFKQILQMVSQGKEHQFSITFVEGSTLKQWLAQLSDNPHIKHSLIASKNGYEQVAQALQLAQQNPEGLFYPDTYAFTKQTTDIEILRRAQLKMDEELTSAWQQRSAGLPYESAYEALIMASIIEKESGKYAEHEIIASVFVNRLNMGMRLQTDPTIIYGLGERYQGDIKREHMREKTAYNTYRINGLPPTPIAMPGKSAIEAAMHPAATDYLYFVSNGQGQHIFSTTLTEHNKAVAQYQLVQK